MIADDGKIRAFASKGRDGKELFRSAKVQGTAYARIDVDVTGVRKLTLRVESGKQGDAACWTVWGSPMVTR